MDEKLIDITTEENVEAEGIEEIIIEVEESTGWVSGDSDRHYGLLGRNDPNQHEISAITGLRAELDEIERIKTVYSDKYGVADYYAWSDGLRYDNFGYFVSITPRSNKIEICKGADVFGVTVDKNRTAFIGGYDANKYDEENDVYDNSYALVATSGYVDVRCATDVGVGDYVVPYVVQDNDNNLSVGMAKKSESGYGYKVVAIDKWGADPYATIAFNIPADQIDKIGTNVGVLNERMDDAHARISEAMMAAARAEEKANSAMDSNNSISDKVNGAYDCVEDIQSKVSNIYQDIQDAKNDAIASANKTIKDAIDNVNDKWAQANEDLEGNVKTAMGQQEERLMSYAKREADEVFSLLTSVDQYSVGPYSQTYGLTLSQARVILSDEKYGEDMQGKSFFYIPTSHGDAYTHKEVYTYTDKDLDPESETDAAHTFYKEFTVNYCYEWKNGVHTIKMTDKDGNAADLTFRGYWWDARSKMVAPDLTREPSPTEFEFWYTNGSVSDDLRDKGYESYTLYVWRDAKVDEETGEVVESRGWKKVNTLADNVNNRLTSMISHTANGISASVANTQGSVAALDARVGTTETELLGVTRWKSTVEDDVSNIATIRQTANDAGASIAQVASRIRGEYTTIDGAWSATDKKTNVVYYCTNDKHYYYYSQGAWKKSKYPSDAGLQYDAASIVAAINDSGSGVRINADHIDIDGDISVSLRGQVIDLTADEVEITSDHFSVDKDGNMEATSGQIGGWTINEDYISKGSMSLVSSDAISLGSLISNGTTSPVRMGVGLSGILFGEFTIYVQPENIEFVNGYMTFEHTAENEVLGAWISDYGASDPDYEWEMFSRATVRTDGRRIIVTIPDPVGWEPQDGGFTFGCTVKYTYSDGSELGFALLEDGSLYANGAKIRGQIDTMSGKMAGFNIDGTSLITDAYYFDEDGTTRRSCLRSPGKDDAGYDVTFAIGYKDGEELSTAPFYVTFDGSTYASRLTIGTPDGGLATVNEGGFKCRSKRSEDVNASPFYILGDAGCFCFTGLEHEENMDGDSVYGEPMAPFHMVFGWSPKGLMPHIPDHAYGPHIASEITGLIIQNDGTLGLRPFGVQQGYLLGTWLSESEITVYSDKNLKYDIASLEENYSSLFDALVPLKFKYKSGTSNRYHMGFIAQDVREAIENNGLNTSDFAPYVEFTNEDGNIECGLRYGEFIPLNTWQIQKLKPRVTTLEEKVQALESENAELKEQISQLLKQD